MPNKNWKDRGLGWIPEYPDLRDYSIGNEKNVRLKVEVKTALVEKQASNLLRLIEEMNNELNTIKELKTIKEQLKENNQETSAYPTNESQISSQNEKNTQKINEKNTQKIIDELKNEIFDEIIFIKVKVHKIFRYSFLPENELINKVPDQNNLSRQQILELKKYLSVLVINGNPRLKPPKIQKQKTKKTGEKKVNFRKAQEVFKWMRKENYDLTTQGLVKEFQKNQNIQSDGIFGLETYTTLNEHFSEPQEQKTSPSNQDNNGSSSKNKLISKIRFVSVTSLIPSIAIDTLLDFLIKKAVEKIYKECEENYENSKSTKDQLDSIIFEQDFLKKIAVEETDFFKNQLNIVFQGIIKKYDEYKSQNNDSTLNIPNYSSQMTIKKATIKNPDFSRVLLEKFKTEASKDLWSGIKSKNDNKRFLYPEIIEAFRDSYLIEPIVSSAIKMLYPLAQFKNKKFEELIEEGLNKFENALLSLDNSNLEISDEDNQLAGLAEAAIQKSLHLLKMQIESLVEEMQNNSKDQIESPEEEVENNSKDEDKYQSQIFLCFLITKYLNHFEKQIKKFEDQIQTNEASQSNINIFDKQDLFEIDYGENSDSENSELFPTLELSIPIVDNDVLKKIKSNCQDKTNKKQYSLLPSLVDLSFWCSPVRDQGSLNSCTAFAAISLYEYFVNRAFNKKIDASPLFLYKAARNKMNVTEDVGSSIRETMKALALYGVPPEDSWSYDEDKVNEEPPAYCYAYAQNYKSLKYFLLDYAGIQKETLLFQIKAVLAAGFPCIFGFTMYRSVYDDSNDPGHIPFPDPESDKVVGGHTIVAVGYDDFQYIQCADRKKYSEGAFLIRNSWGEDWGVDGYGWLPYDYVLAGLTAAWWSLIKSEWFNEGHFGAAGSGGVPGLGNR